MLTACLNFTAIFLITFFIGRDKWYKNLPFSILITLFLILEGFSYLYFGRKIDETFIFFLFNIQIFCIAVSVKILIIYFAIVSTIFLLLAIQKILDKIQIKRYRKTAVTACFLILLSPFGFLYEILYVLTINYGKDYIAYKNRTYQDIFREVKGIDYVTNSELKILNKNENHKNLVLIYLESYDQSYLENDEIKKYAKDIAMFSKRGEFYKNIEQLDGTMGTLAGIISSQCGSKYLGYFIFANPYSKVNKNYQLVCLPNVLNKAGYTQVFIGGADKQLFNKGNYFASHHYDVVEDEHSLVKKNPSLKGKLLSWGVGDYDIFKIAKEEYKNLSNAHKPFNLTLLTTATHNVNGVFDRRCKNSTDNNLLNGIECTNDLLRDFINFIEQQPNHKNTLIVIMPDHKQYEFNGLRDRIKEDDKKLYVILLNSGNIRTYDNTIDYLQLPEILLERLNVKSNAVFLNNQTNETSKNFMHKIHYQK